MKNPIHPPQETVGRCPECGGGPNMRYRVKAGSPFSHWVDCSNAIHRDTHNPTEEQTSRTGEDFTADGTPAGVALWKQTQQQKEIDRLRSALEKIKSFGHDDEIMIHGPGCRACIAKAALGEK